MRTLWNSLLICLLVLGVANSLKPFYGWSAHEVQGIENKKEIADHLSASELAGEIKSVLDSDKAFSTVLYLRPNFDSDSLAHDISSKY